MELQRVQKAFLGEDDQLNEKINTVYLKNIESKDLKSVTKRKKRNKTQIINMP